jgi:aspartate/methionine/tyrosine aminotransferase
MEAEALNLVGYDQMEHNLSESSVRDRTLGELGIDLGNMSLPYGHHLGEPKLRQLIAKQSAPNISPDDILVTAGAAGSLFLISSSLLEREDQIVVGFPNYATNFETPLAIGSDVVFHHQTFEQSFRINVDRLKTQITPKTKYISLTVPHNPSGILITEDELRRVITLVEEHGIYLLFDETYRDLTYGTPLPVAASLSESVISVGSMSKAWGVPGIRIGWLISRNKALVNKLIAGKEQIGITGSVVDEEIAFQILAQKDTLLPVILSEVADSLRLTEDWVNSEAKIEWVRPGGGVAALIRIPDATESQMVEFYKKLKDKYKVYVAPGYWFKLPLNQMRIGFCWSSLDSTRRGLQLMSDAIRESF